MKIFEVNKEKQYRAWARGQITTQRQIWPALLITLALTPLIIMAMVNIAIPLTNYVLGSLGLSIDWNMSFTIFMTTIVWFIIANMVAYKLGASRPLINFKLAKQLFPGDHFHELAEARKHYIGMTLIFTGAVIFMANVFPPDPYLTTLTAVVGGLVAMLWLDTARFSNELLQYEMKHEALNRIMQG